MELFLKYVLYYFLKLRKWNNLIFPEASISIRCINFYFMLLQFDVMDIGGLFIPILSLHADMCVCVCVCVCDGCFFGQFLKFIVFSAFSFFSLNFGLQSMTYLLVWLNNYIFD